MSVTNACRSWSFYTCPDIGLERCTCCWRHVPRNRNGAGSTRDCQQREQLQREQGLRTQKMLTLDEVGRRLALGDFHELNVIVKGDVDGSVEALSDSLIRLSTEESR
mgnify:CR=1 FL=1